MNISAFSMFLNSISRKRELVALGRQIIKTHEYIESHYTGWPNRSMCLNNPYLGRQREQIIGFNALGRKHGYTYDLIARPFMYEIPKNFRV